MTVDLRLLDSVQFATIPPVEKFYLSNHEKIALPLNLTHNAIPAHPDNAPTDHRKLLFVAPNLVSIFKSFQTALLHGSDVTLVLNSSAFTPAPRGKTRFTTKTPKNVTIFPLHGKTKIKLFAGGELRENGILDVSGSIYGIQNCCDFEIEVDKEVLVGMEWRSEKSNSKLNQAIQYIRQFFK
ncbi:hypothetical protein SS50377_27294 [Spironucleus salmonicida]|uniref:Uncharacterized protein n=1 Tax=Spironucleus salmonicida TaxID=348837 RepID=V6LRS0_9EUKA|nr:hypothetical protein SS50377_28826 [Spironucleus salmonicida]KAH0571000.1 hypothetical protein SS50377_27294 [Spironucleus salmonicida]|eukprot:EST46958.1 Hypothetical protein SS50377_12993 [Spironucleus salmonicida]